MAPLRALDLASSRRRPSLRLLSPVLMTAYSLTVPPFPCHLARSHSETGACLEYLLKNDVLGVLERMSESDRPSGVRAEVLNVFNLLVALLDEKFLVHNAVSTDTTKAKGICGRRQPTD